MTNPSAAAPIRADSIEIEEDLISRARDLAPVFRARARDAEKMRQIPAESIADLDAAGLLKVLLPRRFGGYECDLRVAFKVLQEVGRGCASTAWCLSVYQQHAWIVAHFPPQAQEETLGAIENPHVAAVLQPRGKGRRVDGGYVLEGAWPFASGCDHAEWFLIGALVVDDDLNEIPIDREVDGVPARNIRLCLVPRADVAIRGDWDTAGLAATGSHTVALRDVFVPEHRALFIPDVLDGRSPGHKLHSGPLFRTPYYALISTTLGGMAPGVARGALDAFLERIDSRMVQPMNLVQSGMIRTHRQVAQITADIEISEMLLDDLAERIMAVGRSGAPMSALERARARLNTALATRFAYTATEAVFLAAGGSTLTLKSPIQRAMRDIHGISAHYTMDLESGLELKGMVQLGKAPFTTNF